MMLIGEPFTKTEKEATKNHNPLSPFGVFDEACSLQLVVNKVPIDMIICYFHMDHISFEQNTFFHSIPSRIDQLIDNQYSIQYLSFVHRDRYLERWADV